jgi:hypothetical protein
MRGIKCLFVFLRWGKSRTAWRSICPVWPPIFSVAVCSKFIGLYVFLFNPLISLQYWCLGSHVSYIGNRDRVRHEKLVVFQLTFPFARLDVYVKEPGDDYPVKNP